jgi:hypothetical protein
MTISRRCAERIDDVPWAEPGVDIVIDSSGVGSRTQHENVLETGRGLRSLPVEDGGQSHDLAKLPVPAVGRLAVTGDHYEPFMLLGPDGAVVEPAAAFFRDLLAAGGSESTVRSYGMDLLRWFRFVWAAGLAWDQVTSSEARDFSRWLRAPRDGREYAPSVRAHNETVLRGFYGFHLDAGTGPIVNPFPLDRSGRQGAGCRASQPGGAAPPAARRPVPAADSITGPAGDPG